MYHVRPGNKYQLFNKHVRKFPTSFHKSLTLTAFFNHLRQFFHKSRITKNIKSQKKRNMNFFFNARNYISWCSGKFSIPLPLELFHKSRFFYNLCNIYKKSAELESLLNKVAGLQQVLRPATLLIQVFLMNIAKF